MKDTILGIKDYCKDCWHDWLNKRLLKVESTRIQGVWLWKEGNVWHYIRQRKIASDKKGKHKE